MIGSNILHLGSHLDQLLKLCLFLLFNVKVSNRGWDELKAHKPMYLYRKNQKIDHFSPSFMMYYLNILYA